MADAWVFTSASSLRFTVGFIFASLSGSSFDSPELFLHPFLQERRRSQLPPDHIMQWKNSPPKALHSGILDAGDSFSRSMIHKVWERFFCLVHEPKIIVVDDGSSDGAQEIVKQLQQLYGENHILLRARAKNLGLGTAYIHELNHVLDDFVVIMDDDLSHHPKYLPSFIE